MRGSGLAAGGGLGTILLVLAVTGCASSRVSLTQRPSGPPIPVHAIALAPGGGLLADAIGVEFSNQNFTVIDSNQMTSLMARLNMDEIEISLPRGLAKLKEKGIDAVLSVKAAAGGDGRPQSASVRLNSTVDGKVVAGLSWQNGWGGREGSIADRSMRKDLADAAAEIVAPLIKAIHGEEIDE